MTLATRAENGPVFFGPARPVCREARPVPACDNLGPARCRCGPARPVYALKNLGVLRPVRPVLQAENFNQFHDCSDEYEIAYTMLVTNNYAIDSGLTRSVVRMIQSYKEKMTS